MKFSKISSISVWKFAISIVILLVSIELFPLGLSVTLGTPLSLAQTLNSRKLEADRLMKQGFELVEASQFEDAIKSWKQAIKNYSEIKAFVKER